MDVIKDCPQPGELLLAAFRGAGEVADAAVLLHVEGCAECRRRMMEMRAVATALHGIPVSAADDGCLDDDAIARLADGEDLNASAEAIRHVADCAKCRARVAAVCRLTADETVSSAIRGLEHRPRGLRRWSRRTLAITTGLAAAAAAAIVVVTQTGRVGDVTTETAAHRDPAVTATAAPRIISPGREASRGDSLRWSGVPQAELYRVRIWNTEGTVVWTTDTRGTAVAIPEVLADGTPYLWEVKARTGWDRWVASEFVELVMRAPGPG